MCAHTSLSGHQFLYGVSRGTGHAFQFLGADFLSGIHLSARVSHHHLVHLLASAAQGHVQSELALWFA